MGECESKTNHQQQNCEHLKDRDATTDAIQNESDKKREVARIACITGSAGQIFTKLSNKTVLHLDLFVYQQLETALSSNKQLTGTAVCKPELVCQNITQHT